MQHPSDSVQQAIVRLDDELCSWERSTSRESVLIIREQGGFEHRSMSGKPALSADEISDSQLMLVATREL